MPSDAATPEVRCPCCQRSAMTLGQKLRLGPGHAVLCAACGAPVTVARAPALAVALLLVPAIAVTASLWPSPAAVAVIPLALAAMFYLHAYRVALVEGRRADAPRPPTAGRVLFFRLLVTVMAALAGGGLVRWFGTQPRPEPQWGWLAGVVGLLAILALGYRLGPLPTRPGRETWKQ